MRCLRPVYYNRKKGQRQVKQARGGFLLVARAYRWQINPTCKLSSQVKSNQESIPGVYEAFGTRHRGSSPGGQLFFLSFGFVVQYHRVGWGLGLDSRFFSLPNPGALPMPRLSAANMLPSPLALPMAAACGGGSRSSQRPQAAAGGRALNAAA